MAKQSRTLGTCINCEREDLMVHINTRLCGTCGLATIGVPKDERAPILAQVRERLKGKPKMTCGVPRGAQQHKQSNEKEKFYPGASQSMAGPQVDIIIPETVILPEIVNKLKHTTKKPLRKIHLYFSPPDFEILARLEKITKKERRTLSSQIIIFIEAGLNALGCKQ